jgi:hypothetical protein
MRRIIILERIDKVFKKRNFFFIILFKEFIMQTKRALNEQSFGLLDKLEKPKN